MKTCSGPASCPWVHAFRCVVGSVLIAVIASSPIYGQRSARSVTVGLQAGQPGGVTAKLYGTGHTAYDALVTTDGDDFVTAHLHRVWERPLPDSMVHTFVGPGLVVGGRHLDTDPSPELGMSGHVGLNFFANRFEVFLQVTPTLRFLPSVRPSVGGSVGLRYALSPP